MIVSVKELTSAVNKISSAVAKDKNPIGVYLKISDNSLRVAYHDGRKAIFEDIPAEAEEGDVKEPVVVNYTRMCSVMDACQPSGQITTDNMTFKFSGTGIIRVRAEKKIPVIVSEEAEEVEYKVCSVFEQTITYENIGANMKTAVMGRIDYDKIAEAEEYMSVSTKNFVSILDKCATEQGKVVYISPKMQIAFVSNLYSLNCIKLEDGYSAPLAFASGNARILADVVGKLKDEEIAVCTPSEKYVNIFNESKTFGIWIEMQSASQTHLTALSRYRNKSYKDAQLTFVKAVLQNVVKSALNYDKVENATFGFGEAEDFCGLEMRFSSNNTGASIANDYSIACSACYNTFGNISDLKINMSLKVLDAVLSYCEQDYVGMDVDINEDGSMFIRVADIDAIKKSSVECDLAEEVGVTYGIDLPEEVKAAAREEAMKAMYYTVATKG